MVSSPAVATVVKMLESLPEPVQGQVVEHLREYLEDLRDELQWDASFERTQYRLASEAKRVRQEIAEGRAEPLDIDEL